MDNFSYIEELHQAWHGDRGAVSPGWDAYFSDLHAAARRPAPAAEEGADGRGADMVYKQGRVDSLLWAYRDVGYLYADLNPLAAPHAQEACELSPHSNGDYEQLELEDFGLSEEDLDTSFAAGRAMTPSRAPLRDIVAAYRETYCASIGVEFLHIQNRDIRHWLVQQMESCRNQAELGRAEKRIFLEDLIKAEEFERFLGLHFVGQKRFSLEGAEVVIPALHSLVNWGAHANQIEQIVIGTTHRGRLSVLRHILDLAPEEITSEFEENYGPGVYHGTGDVKYHLGYSTDHVHADGSQVHLSLVPNPSHLESVDPVVEGKVRAVQEQIGDVRRQRVLPVLLHGDAAFSGQGVVAETLNLSQLEGYRTGGTIHIVINNQIGFTTPARHGRSGFFPTDIVKMLPIPVFHVNGDDPEAIIHVMKLALTFRQTFHQDVVVDIFCFRRYGHNEGDEPSFTHPCMYRLVRKHPGVAALYGERCEAAGVMEAAEQSQIRESVQGELRDALERTRAGEIRRLDLSQGGAWEGIGTTYSF
ncbi:MAG: 2-oxoglutarate dehydrogenase E1 component, partial [Lentisphaerae bacterium]|nr:2-oxoglutarate dehydrogenase E1 component [Lentisphaerota bacterium]